MFTYIESKVPWYFVLLFGCFSKEKSPRVRVTFVSFLLYNLSHFQSSQMLPKKSRCPHGYSKHSKSWPPGLVPGLYKFTENLPHTYRVGPPRITLLSLMFYKHSLRIGGSAVCRETLQCAFAMVGCS